MIPEMRPNKTFEKNILTNNALDINYLTNKA